jgi:hypothetical protein
VLSGPWWRMLLGWRRNRKGCPQGVGRHEDAGIEGGKTSSRDTSESLCMTRATRLYLGQFSNRD